jgi:hypothetical protein
VILGGSKAIRVVERAVTTADDVDGDVGVRTDEEGVAITWVCGGRRVFAPEDLEETIGHLEVLQAFPDVWFEGADSNGTTFMARVVDGELYANDSRAEDGDHVPWGPLKKAARKAGA